MLGIKWGSQHLKTLKASSLCESYCNWMLWFHNSHCPFSRSHQWYFLPYPNFAKPYIWRNILFSWILVWAPFFFLFFGPSHLWLPIVKGSVGIKVWLLLKIVIWVGPTKNGLSFDSKMMKIDVEVDVHLKIEQIIWRLIDIFWTSIWSR